MKLAAFRVLLVTSHAAATLRGTIGVAGMRGSATLLIVLLVCGCTGGVGPGGTSCKHPGHDARECTYAPGQVVGESTFTGAWNATLVREGLDESGFSSPVVSSTGAQASRENMTLELAHTTNGSIHLTFSVNPSDGGFGYTSQEADDVGKATIEFARPAAETAQRALENATGWSIGQIAWASHGMTT